MTCDLVVAESSALMVRRGRHEAAAAFLRASPANRRVERIESGAAVELEAGILLLRFTDQSFGPSLP